MTRTLFALALAAGFVATAAAAEVKYPLTADNTKIEFVGTKPGGKHDGGFKTLSGNAAVTDGKLETLKIDLTIECDSLYSDQPGLTKHLKDKDFFDVKNHPKATFKTTKVEKGDKTYTITGDLTMLGKTVAISFPASVSEKDGVLSLSTSFQIDRTQWGMNFGADGKVDKTVTLKVAVTAKK
jgi:polyisoprenoid-binding protein YceI